MNTANHLSNGSLNWIVGPGSEWFWTMVQAFAVVITLIFIFRQIRLQSQANMLSTLFSLRDRWESLELSVARSSVCARYLNDRTQRQFGPDEERVATFFEDVGVYLRNGAFTARTIWDQYSYYTMYYWAVLEPLIVTFRDETSDDSWYEYFIKLQLAMHRISKRRGLPTEPLSEKALAKFASDEIADARERVARASHVSH